ncbi:MAG: zinc ribbon domain-containing protein [Thermoproteus sp.]
MRVRCPFCGAEYDVPDGATFAVCPYCGTALREGRTYGSVYIFEPRLDSTAAFRRALAFRPWASPSDLSSASPASAELHFLPLYLYRVEFPPYAELATYATALALKDPPFYIPEDYRFPARWRAPFKASLERRAVFHQPQLSPEEAWSRARRPYDAEARAYASAFKTPVEARSGFEGLVYYPFWRLQYGYRDKKYAAVVDAAEGDVVYMEYPISVRGRAQSAIAATALIVGAVVVGAIAGAFAFHPLWGMLGGAVGGVGGAARLLAFVVGRKAVYRQGRSVELL